MKRKDCGERFRARGIGGDFVEVRFASKCEAETVERIKKALRSTGVFIWDSCTKGCAPEPAKPEPRFKVGDRVRVARVQILAVVKGTTARITNPAPYWSDGANGWRYRILTDSDISQTANESELEPYTPDPVREAAQALVDAADGGSEYAIVTRPRIDALRDALSAEVAA